MSVILTQTDTTVGFLSQDKDLLYKTKSRPQNKPLITVYSSFKDFLASNNRVPNSSKNIIRRAKKTTFIIKNKAFRVTQDMLDSNLLRNYKWKYSTSANESNKKYSKFFAYEKADIIVEDKNGLIEKSSSSLIKLNSKKRIKLR